MSFADFRLRFRRALDSLRGRKRRQSSRSRRAREEHIEMIRIDRGSLPPVSGGTLARRASRQRRSSTRTPSPPRSPTKPVSQDTGNTSVGPLPAELPVSVRVRSPNSLNRILSSSSVASLHTDSPAIMTRFALQIFSFLCRVIFFLLNFLYFTLDLI